MAIPQIDAATCSIIFTGCLWMWTRLKLPEGCPYRESNLRRQNICVFWAFSALVILELAFYFAPTATGSLITALTSGLVFVTFAIIAYKNERSFWSNRMNQYASLGLSLLAVFLVWSAVKLPNFVPVLSALAIAHLCRKRYIDIVVSSLREKEAVQARLLRQEAIMANMRNFEAFSIRKSS